MPRHTIKTCEPFRAWNRLESRPRKYDFDRVLKSEIHDPLWFLTRQWQFGEFKGEDTGSPVFAKVLMETTEMVKYQGLQGAVENFPNAIPLETQVEQQPFQLGFKERIQIGNHWWKLLRIYGAQYNQNRAASDPAFEELAYQTELLTAYPLRVPELDETSSETTLQSAQLLSNYRLMNVLRVAAGKSPDGVLLYQAIQDNQTAFILNLRREKAHQTLIQETVNDFLAWFAGQFPEIPPLGGAWNANQLEYQFKCALPEATGKNTVVAANEYYNGRLDWFAFDVESLANRSGPISTSDKDTKTQAITEKVISFIPSPAAFGGMPSNRFWEFEDGQVDLGNINADTTDISKIVVVEYATMYGNNWYLIPYPIDAGTLSTVKGIVVTDVFGQKTFIEAAIQGESDDWYSWGMFNLTSWDAERSQALAADTRILIPPALPKIQESESVEEVIFLRDEMSNLVWAVENKINNLLGMGMDGHKAASELLTYLQSLNETTPIDLAENAVLKYLLGNTVPENWIPFMAIHLSGQNRAVQLQRASMPRQLNGANMPVRPRNQLLRYGFEDQPGSALAPYINPSSNEQQQAYFIHEEEIPRAGIIVKGTFQRSRWYGGKIVQWYGYKKQFGKGEGGSGLVFDRVEYVENGSATEG